MSRATGPGPSWQVERQHLGRLTPDESQAVGVTDGRAVALSQHGAVDGDRSSGHVDPGMAPGAERKLATLLGSDEGDPEIDVLVDLETAVPPVPRDEQHELPARLRAVEGLLTVRRLEASRVRHDPDLQKMHGLGRRVVGFTVSDAGTRPHHLDLSRPDHAAPARAVLVLQCALEHVGQDLHVTVTVGTEPGAGLDAIVVDHSQHPEAHVRGVVVVAERKGVAAVEPPPVGAATVLGGSNLDHGRSPFISILPPAARLQGFPTSPISAKLPRRKPLLLSRETIMRIEPVVLTRGEKTITSTYYGSAHPRQDMPRIADWAQRGLLDVAGLVTRRYPLAAINRAYEDIETDAVGRGVISF